MTNRNSSPLHHLTMTIEQTYNDWRAKLKEPDDSLFYYHPNMEHILLGFAIFVLSSKPILQKLGKAECLTLLHRYIPDLITAWIDEDEKAFETMWPLTMTVAEIYTRVAFAFADEYPSKSRQIKKLAIFYGNAVAIAGDMSEAKATDLLEDLSTDGTNLYSDKITDFGNDLLFQTTQYGMDIPPSKLAQLMGWGGLIYQRMPINYV